MDKEIICKFLSDNDSGRGTMIYFDTIEQIDLLVAILGNVCLNSVIDQWYRMFVQDGHSVAVYREGIWMWSSNGNKEHIFKFGCKVFYASSLFEAPTKITDKLLMDIIL